MAEELTRSVEAWSAQLGESKLEDQFLPQWTMRLVCLLLCPILPMGAVFGILWAFKVPALIVAMIVGVVLAVLGGAVSAFLRIRLVSGKTVTDGETLVYTGGSAETVWYFLKSGLLSLVTLGLYWVLGFNAVATNKARYSRTTRGGKSNIKRSGFIGNFLHIVVPKLIITLVPLIIMCATGLIPLREHGEDFMAALGKPSSKLLQPTMHIWGFIKSVVRNGASAFADATYYNEVTTLIWTGILLFIAGFLLIPWYRHKMLAWETSHTSVDGYQMRFNAGFGAYAANAYFSLLGIAVPSVLLLVLFLFKRKIVPAVWLILVMLTALLFLAALAWASYRAARFRAKNTQVLTPPSPIAPWDDYLIEERMLHLSLKESVRELFNPAARRRAANYFKRYWTLYALLVVPVIYIVIFKYIPMLFIQIGAKQNNIVYDVWDVSWAKNYGFEWLITAFKNIDFSNAVRNTLVLNGLDLIFGFPAPIILAILLNELAFKKFKRISQTVFYMPHFLSWVIISSLALSLFNPTNGLANMALEKMGAGGVNPFYDSFQWVIMYCLLGIWQGAGWGTIIYLAAITNINTELYEAAVVDGAGRFRKIWHITLPGLRPTIITLLIMRMGSIIGSDFERPFALKNGIVAKWSDVISIFVYDYGLKGNKFSLSAAVGIFQSAVCLIFLFGANALAKKFGERGVW